jgi:Flp pilus assembly protein TadD
VPFSRFEFNARPTGDQHPHNVGWPLVLMTACVIALSGCASTDQTIAQKIAAAEAEVIHKEMDASKSALERGDDALAHGDRTVAAAFYREAHDEDPSALIPVLRLGETELALGQYAQAFAAFQTAQALKPSDPGVAFRLGELLLMRDSPKSAIAELQTALRARPSDPAIFSAIGVAYTMLAKYDLAIENYEAGLALVPNQMGLLNNLGLAQFLSGDYDDAIGTLTALVALPNSLPRYRRNLAFIYTVHGDLAKAHQIIDSDAERAALDAQVAAYRATTDNSSRSQLIGIHFAEQALNARSKADVGGQVSATLAAQQ